MLQAPGESWDEYAKRYREGWSPHRDRILIGTTAIHKLGDISRDEPDYFMIDETADQSGEDYIGNWVTGFGFIHVRFPKATSRPVTDAEWEWFLDNPVVMA
jgi:hypothetical protein